jgi:hypothetical protein
MSQQVGINRGGGGGHGGGGGGHGGGHGGGGGLRRSNGFQRHEHGWGDREWGTNVYEPPPLPVDDSCGDPIPMTNALAMAGQEAFETGGTYPAFGYVNGTMIRFSVSGGHLVAQPCSAGFVGDPPPLPASSGPAPTGSSMLDDVKSLADRVFSLPGEALRAASREFEREIASVKASGAVSDPPALQGNPVGLQPTGISLKSIDTPDYLRSSVAALYEPK